MKDTVHTEQYKGFTIEIAADSSPESPRDWDNLGKMICFHGRYTLGDPNPPYTQRDQGSWQELADKLIAEQNAVVILPLYLYDHSGITMSTGKFSCPWDSGQVGFIYITREKFEKEHPGKRLTKEMKENLELQLQGEVETYDQYLTGQVYGYTLLDAEGEHVDSCWGYFGDYDGKDYGALIAAKESADGEVARALEKRMKESLALTGLEE